MRIIHLALVLALVVLAAPAWGADLDRWFHVSWGRSEEHTSELQSRLHIVCRLLLENNKGYFLEVHQHYAKNIIVGFARLDGKPAGIVANQPAVLAGTPAIHTSLQGPLLSPVSHPRD